jgi:hypothetical protein
LAPDFFGDPILVLRGNNEDDGVLKCLIVRQNYQPRPRFEEEDSKIQKKAGIVHGNVYYEYVDLKPE